VVCGWLFYSSLLPTLLQQAFAPQAKPAHNAVLVPEARVPSQPMASAPVVGPPIAQVSAEERRARGLAIVAQARQKNLAFAAFYSPPASCEHPADWSAQVDCGNQYIRAKRAFEEKWEAEHLSLGGGAEVVLGNQLEAAPRK
jgi:hypothetical protein